VAAVALVAAPYKEQAAALLQRSCQAVRKHAGILSRIGAAALLIAAAYGKVPMPVMPSQSPSVIVETPSVEMIAAVAPVAKALRTASPIDRALWAAIWEKSAKVVNGDATTTEVVFTDTRSLRAYNIIALRLAWVRMGGNPTGKYPGLAEAAERFLSDTIGLDVVPVTPELRAKVVESYKALAWAGIGGG
jgi:hypothetical protein